MPIVFVHGVATRTTDEGYASSWRATEAFLREYVAPVVAGEAHRVAIVPAYWGDVAARLSRGGISRPRGPLLGMGVHAGAGMGTAGVPALQPAALVELADVELAAALPAAALPAPMPLGPPAAPPGLTAAGPPPGLTAAGPPAGPPGAASGDSPGTRLRDLDAEQLSDLVVATLPAHLADPADAARWAVAADAVARDPATAARLVACGTVDEETTELLRLVSQRQGDGGLAGMGAGGWRTTWRTRLAEAVARATSAPGFAVSRALAEIRGPVNDLATGFIGDVFVYLAGRGDAGSPGPIPAIVLAGLREARRARLTDDEPMVVVTHSMGGQIMYDLVTAVLPGQPDGMELRVDFWCATASQVGLFEELRLFLRSDPNRTGAAAPFPSRDQLGYWWNVWDYNDFISYSVRGIVDGADDEAYSSGLSVLGAHSGYLRRPSFYRRLAEKLEAARRLHWGRRG
ncbi:MAG TPA: hypothetical protein VFM54_06575 [Micromonosporaceae bacterium]|nr:hypothetical protein [Micromonosporaceae bacterium]